MFQHQKIAKTLWASSVCPGLKSVAEGEKRLQALSQPSGSQGLKSASQRLPKSQRLWKSLSS